MLHHARAGDLTVLGDVADQHHRDAAFLGQPDQFAGAGADLGDRTGTGFMSVAPQRLNRIDHHQIEGFALQPLQDVAQRCLGRQVDGSVGHAHAVGARADLLDGLLAGDIGAASATTRRLAADLQQKGGLADPGVAAQQDRRAGHDAAAADAVELGDASRDPFQAWGFGGQAFEGQAPGLGPPGRREGARRTGGDLLHHGVPGPASRALTGPFGMDRATGLAGVDGAVAGHGAPDSMKRESTATAAWAPQKLRITVVSPASGV